MNRIKRVLSIIAVTACFLFPASLLMASSAKVTLDNADIIGAGATFPNPLYQRWIKEFAKTNPGFSIFYDSVGSGDGVKRFMAKKVDFGASDSAMTDEQIAQVQQGVQLVPVTAGSIAIAYNLPDIKGELRLSREVYADIFLGLITNWNDKRIKQLNPQLNLPNLNIITVTRSDSSGTTWAFTNHLQAISRKWGELGFMVGKEIDWPGYSMASRYNEGVAGTIKKFVGTIGYVEYGIAKRGKLTMAALENREGEFIQPDETSGSVTLANNSVKMPDNLRMFLPDPDGKNSYPIVTYTWFLLYKNHPDAEKASKINRFITWSLTHGQNHSASLGYIPLPDSVVASSLKVLENVR
jgi:phosphate transport system substrate-binding protein